jgi:DNA-binding NarL/FixJ family response regulator
MRVLVVDDQDYIRRGLKAFLSEEPGIEVCGEAANGSEAITMVRQLTPDVVVMDISMPIVDGILATTIIRKAFPRVQVITLSQYELDDLTEVLKAGALTHVPKLALWEKLLPALRSVQVKPT